MTQGAQPGCQSLYFQSILHTGPASAGSMFSASLSFQIHPMPGLPPALGTGGLPQSWRPCCQLQALKPPQNLSAADAQSSAVNTF